MQGVAAKREVAGAESERPHRFDKPLDRERAGKTLQQKLGIERQAVDPAQAAGQPDKVLARKAPRRHFASLVESGNHLKDPDGRYRYQRLAEQTTVSVLREELGGLSNRNPCPRTVATYW